MKTLILIPARMSSKRFPNKPMALIKGKPMIERVWKQAILSNLGDVIVACSETEVFNHITSIGGIAEMTDPNLPSGTDRIYEAIQKLGRSDVDYIMNLQGDEPLMNIEDIKNLNNKMIQTKSKLGTLASNISDDKLYDDQNVVKVITKESLDISEFPEALDFIRKTSNVSENIYHHLGIYCYQLETLKNFVSYDQSHNEIKNKLEQLRALDNNIKINVALAKSSPIGVDTQEDFVAIKKIMEYKS